MATNKHAIIRYQALDKCFRNTGRMFFIEDLVEACSEAILSVDSQCGGVNKRQVQYDIVFMESEAGWSVPLAKHKYGRRLFYRYEDADFSINKQPLNDNEASQLREALLTLSRFKGMPQFEWMDEIIARLESGLELKTVTQKVIGFDENPFLKGLEHISPIYDSIINKHAVSITYKSFKEPNPFTLVFHPWYLKQYNKRWFVFGLNDVYKNLQNLALDRIESIAQTHIAYIENTEIDFDEFFEEVIGVTVDNAKTTEKILIKVANDQWPYIESKPLHGSQKKKGVMDDGVLVEIEVILNYELDATLLSFGDSIEVIEPPVYRQHFAEKVKKMNDLYIKTIKGV